MTKFEILLATLRGNAHLEGHLARVKENQFKARVSEL